MKGNKALIATIAIIIGVLVLAGFMAISSHLPLIGKAFELIFAIMLVIVIILIFTIASKSKRK